MCCGDHFACVFAAVWSIVQSCIHLVFCLWGTNFYECKYEINEGTFQYFWYLTYFYSDTCVTPHLQDVYVLIDQKNATTEDCTDKRSADLLEQLLANVKFPTESFYAYRTYTILRVFIVIDAIWIIAAVGLLIGTCFRIRFGISAVFFFPWSLVVLVVFVLDAVAAGWYGFDVSDTYGLTNWFKSIGGTYPLEIEELHKNFPKISTTIPSILMVLIFGRFILIWLVNVLLFVRVTKAGLNAAGSSGGGSKNKGVGEDCPENARSPDSHADNPNSAAARIRRWQLYYGTTDDDEDEDEGDEQMRTNKETKRPHRRRSRQRHSMEDEGWKKDNAFKYNQQLSVVGGYEGDRSNSPSPLPCCCCHHNSSSGYESSSQPIGCSDPCSGRIQQEVCHHFSVGELKGQVPWTYLPKETGQNQNGGDVDDGDRKKSLVSDGCAIDFNYKDKNTVEVHFAS